MKIPPDPQQSAKCNMLASQITIRVALASLAFHKTRVQSQNIRPAMFVRWCESLYRCLWRMEGQWGLKKYCGMLTEPAFRTRPHATASDNPSAPPQFWVALLKPTPLVLRPCSQRTASFLTWYNGDLTEPDLTTASHASASAKTSAPPHVFLASSKATPSL